MIIWVFTFLIFTSAFAEFPKLDPDKFTICAMTINSSNERNVFEKEVKKNPKKFNPLVELTEPLNENWFNEACASGIKCDQLIISGHFAEKFFGESGLELKLDELEGKGCAKSCEGILSHPYEVFLFGCNTLATKEKDSRTPEEYVRDLMAEGLGHREAILVREARYGAVGDDNRSRMQRSFGGEKKQLYGFHSKGPLGKNIEHFLKNYFKQSPLLERLEKLQAERLMDKVSFANNDLDSVMKLTWFAQCEAGVTGDDEKTRIMCGLRDTKKSVEERLLLMREAFTKENYLAYIPSVNEFLRKNPVSEMTDSQKKMALEINQIPEIKSQILSLVDKAESLYLMVEWSQLALSLGMMEEKERNDLLGKKIKSMFKKNVTQEERELICSIGADHLGKIKLAVKDLSSSMKTEDYLALGCLRPKDKAVQLRLLDGMKDTKYEVRLAILDSFQFIKPQDKSVHLKILESMKDDNEMVQASAAICLGLVGVKDKDIQWKVLEGLNDPSITVRANTLYAIGQMSPDKDIQLKVLDSLEDKSESVRSDVADVFTYLKPQDKEVQLKLLQGFEDQSDYVREKVTKSFIEIKPQDTEIRQKVAAGIVKKDLEFVSTIQNGLEEMGRGDKQVQLIIARSLNVDNFKIRTASLKALESIGPQDQEVQLKLAESISGNRSEMQIKILNLLGKLKPQDKKVQLKIVEELKNLDNDISNLASQTLNEIKPTDSEVLSRIKELDEDLYQELTQE